MSARNAIKPIQNIMRKDVGVDGDAQRLSQLCWMFFLKIIDDQDKQLEVMQDGYRSPIPEKFQWRTWAANPEGLTGNALLNFINDELFPTLQELPITGKGTNRAKVVRSVFEDAYSYMKSGQLVRQVVNKINTVDFNDLAERKHFGEIYEQLLNSLQSAGNAGEYYTPRAVTAFMVDRIDPRPGETLFDPACGTGGFLTCAIRHMRDRYVKEVKDAQALQGGLSAVEKKQLPHMLCVTNMLLHGIEDPSFVRHDNTLARPYISYGKSDRVDIILTNPPFGGKEEDGIESNFPSHFRTRETADLFLALFIRLLKPGGRAAIVLPDGSLFGEGVKTRLKEHLLEECNLHTIVRLPDSVFKPYASIGTNLLFFEKGNPTQDIWFYEHQVPAGQKAYSMTKPIKVEHLRDCVEWWGGAERENREQINQAWKVSIDEIKARNYDLDIKNPHVITDDFGDPQDLLDKLEADEAKTAALRDRLKDMLAEALLQNTARLIEHFDRMAEAPDAVSLLRGFIMDLAVRGKLVEQDPEDEPTSELLKQIEAERTRLVKEGTNKKQPELAPVSADEEPFRIPGSWKWVRFGEIADFSAGRTPSRHNSTFWDTEDYPWFSIADLKDGATVVSTKETISEKAKTECFKSEPVPVGTIIMSFKLTIGKISRLGIPAFHNEAIISIRPHVKSIDHYLFMVLPQFSRQGKTKGAVKGATLNRKSITNILLPLPPLSEQHRIVAKVDELMDLCDQLEAELTTTQSDNRRLLEAVLHEAI